MSNIKTKFPNLKSVLIVPENLLSEDAPEYLRLKKFEFKQKMESIEKQETGYIQCWFQETTLDNGKPKVKLDEIKRNNNDDWDLDSFVDMIQSIYLRMNNYKDEMSKNIEITTEEKKETKEE